MDTISGSDPHRLHEITGLTESRNGRAEMPQDWCARVAQLPLHAHLRLDIYAADCASSNEDVPPGDSRAEPEREEVPFHGVLTSSVFVLGWGCRLRILSQMKRKSLRRFPLVY